MVRPDIVRVIKGNIDAQEVESISRRFDPMDDAIRTFGSGDKNRDADVCPDVNDWSFRDRRPVWQKAVSLVSIVVACYYTISAKAMRNLELAILTNYKIGFWLNAVSL